MLGLGEVEDQIHAFVKLWVHGLIICGLNGGRMEVRLDI